MRPNALISAEANKLLYQKYFKLTPRMTYIIVITWIKAEPVHPLVIVYSIFSRLALLLGHLYNNFGTKKVTK